MIIKRLSLTNFMCYYDDNTFELSEGVNIILGHNGDGKSTIFTAFKWIFDQFFELPIKNVYSEKRFNETTIGDDFDVKVELQVTQYNFTYTIEKSFTVTNENGIAKLSPIRDSVYYEDHDTGEAGYRGGRFSTIINQIFPEEFRNFSMFETETETLNLVKGSQLAQLVQQFSNAGFYEKLENLISTINTKASKAYKQEMKASEETAKKLEDLDSQINQSEGEIKRLQKCIDEDEQGLQVYRDQIDNFARNSKLSEAINNVISQIEEYENKRKYALSCKKAKYTDYLFDNQFLLIGYPKFKDEFSDKVNILRQERNKKECEELAIYVEEKNKLSLENGAVPLPPGSPNEHILNEFIKDGICKICDRPLNEHAKEYINKSLAIYARNKNIKIDNSITPTIFSNTFIKEFEILDEVLNSEMRSNSIYSLKEILSELIEFNKEKDWEINQYNTKLEQLYKERDNILSQVPSSLNEDKLADIINQIPLLIERISDLSKKIERNVLKKDDETKILDERKSTRKKILSQTQGGSFKRETIELLEEIRDIFISTKEREYQKFLTILEKRATAFLKRINAGESTGIIKLYKIGNEVHYKSLNDDGSSRSDLNNSGAVQISIPMSILFAIADIAAEIKDDESYPMIFDAPTGRFSPDREIEFFKALHESRKQRIIVTLRFLGADGDNIYIKEDEFSHIPRNKAFHILRERPIVQGNINTNIHPIN